MAKLGNYSANGFDSCNLTLLLLTYIIVFLAEHYMRSQTPF